MRSLLLAVAIIFTVDVSAQTCLLAEYTFSGDANDRSGNSRDLTVTGATLTTDRFGTANSAYAFDGNDMLSAAGALTTTGSTGFTYTAWIKTSKTSPQATIMQPADHVLYINRFTSGRFMAAFDFSSGNNSSSDQSSAVVANDNWVHVAATNDGSTTKIYVNGSLENSYSEVLSTMSNGDIVIGAQKTSAWYFTGAIDEVRLYGCALKASDIDTIFKNSLKLPVLTDCLTAYYPFSGDADDATGNGYDGTVSGATLTTDRYGNPNSAYAFDGNDHISVSNPFSTDGFAGMTYMAWIRSSYMDIQSTIIQAEGHVLYTNNFSKGSFFAALDATSANNSSSDVSSTSVVTDEWVHVAATNDGFMTRIYVNGMLENSYNEVYAGAAGASIFIGGQKNNMWRFNGNIDDVAIYKCALSSNDIYEIYQDAVTKIKTNNASSGSLRIFPNPSRSGLFMIDLERSDAAVELTVYDAVGRIAVNEETIAGQVKYQLDLTGHRPGVYFLQLREQDQVMTKKIIFE